MTRPIRPATLVDLHQIDRAIDGIREAIDRLKGAGAPRAVKACREALRSVEGAKRHAWHRYLRSKEEAHP